MRKIVFILCTLHFALYTLNAQKVSVTATLDSTVLMIGEQSRLIFQIEQIPDAKVVAPFFSDSLPGGLELVGQLKIDTAQASDGLVAIKHQYTVTAFDEGVYQVPALAFAVGGDTVFSNSVSIKVIQPFVIDTTLNTFADIKPVMQPPFDWANFFKIVLIVWLALLVLLFVIIVLQRFVRKKPILQMQKTEPQLPPDVLAIQALEKVREQKMWQAGRMKEYHTAVSEIIREYVERIFEINSMEMTSGEILEELNKLKKDNKQTFNRLQQILTLADLAKFAKFAPLPDENEMSLINAFEFVKETKKAEEQKTEEQKK